MLEHRKAIRKVTKSNFADGFIDDKILYPLNLTTLCHTIDRWSIRKRVLPIESIEDVLCGPSDKIHGEAFKTLGLPSLAKLMKKLDDNKKEGVITFKRSDYYLNAVLHKGTILNVYSNHIPQDTFCTFLNQSGIISIGEQKEFFERARYSKLSLGNLLVEKNRLTSEELTQLLRQHKIAKLNKVFSGKWENSLCSFWHWKTKPSKHSILSIPLPIFIKYGVLKYAKANEIFKFIFNVDKTTEEIHFNHNFPSVAKRIDLSNDDTLLAKSIEGNSIESLKKNQNPQLFEKSLRLTFLLGLYKTIRFGKPSHTLSLPKDHKIYPVSESLNDAKEFSLPEDGILTQAVGSFLNEQYEDAIISAKSILFEQPDSISAMAILAWSTYQESKNDDKKSKNDDKKLKDDDKKVSFQTEQLLRQLGACRRNTKLNG